MEEWWEERSYYYYIDFAMFFVAICATILCIKMKSRIKSLRYMFLYPLSSVLQAFFTFYNEYSNSTESFFYENITIGCFLIIEFYCLAWFYYQELAGFTGKKFIKLFALGYGLWILISAFVYSIEYLEMLHIKLQTLAILSLITPYIIELFNSPPKANLLNEPAFWITIGSTTLSLGLTPVLFSLSFIFDEDYYLKETFIYTVTFILYIFTFSLLVRALFCNPNTKKIIHI